MENNPKRRKLMTSRSVAGVVGSRVLINDDVGFGGGGGDGGGGRGLTRGAGAVAAVRGRTSPRTGGKVQPGNPVTVNPLTSRLANQHCPGKRVLERKGTAREDDRKNARNLRGNCKGVGGAATRPAKREREIEGDAADAATGTLQSTKDHQGGVAVARLRMAKNAGDSKIPFPGTNRPSFLPKPKIHKKSPILAASTRGLEDGTQFGKEEGSGPYTSTPLFDKLTEVRSELSSVDSLNLKDVGKVVCIGNEKVGTLRYFGALEGEQGIWAGIELPGPGGITDGTIRGRKYFSCAPKHGIMAPIREVQRLNLDSKAPPNFIAPDQNNFKISETNSTFVTGYGPHASVMLPNPASNGVITNSTFIWERNAQPDAGTFILTDATPNTSFVAPDNRENRVATDGKILNETRTLDDKNKKNNRDYMHIQKPRIQRQSIILAGCPRGLALAGATAPGKDGSPVSYTSTPYFDKPKDVKSDSSPMDGLDIKDVGKMVCIGNEKIGTLRYYGALEGEHGTWAGIELFVPGGNSDGTIQGRRYFSCAPKHGIMAPIREVQRLHLDPQLPSSDYTPTNLIISEQEVCQSNLKKPEMNSTFVPGFGSRASSINPNLASIGVIANSTFLSGNNVLPSADFDSKGGANILTETNPDALFVDPNNRENRVITDEKITNETRTLDDKNYKNNKDHSMEKSKAERETDEESLPSMMKIKGTKGSSLLVSPTKLGKLPTNMPTKIISPAKANVGKVTKQETAELPQSSTHATARGTGNSPTRKTCKLNATLVKPVNVCNATYNKINTNDRGILTKKMPNQSTVENRCPDNVGIENKELMIDPKANKDPHPKPTGALFTLNESFMNEKPRNGMHLPTLLSIPHLNLAPLLKTSSSSSKEENESRNLAVKTLLTPNYRNVNFGDSLIDFSSPIQRIPNIQNKPLNLENMLSSSKAESMNPSGLFQSPMLSQIDALTDSCLIDTLSTVDDEDELTPPAAPPPSKATPAPHYLMLNKQNSFEHDESLGILTPDQMVDFTIALECSRTPSCENLTGSGGSRIVLTRASASRPSDLPTSIDGEPTEGSSERTPSPEELPLDPKPAEPTRVVPVSFITSITSITSLEAGYQGDGENSRPASRGADPPHVPQPPNLPAPRPDPMTDSDFFTESDADAHEEIVRGDRRAQVIDGTLFCAPGGRRCPSFTGEEMDSSGIYSDLERKQDEQPNEEAQSEGQTPDTADTVSQKSQPSPNKPEPAPIITDCLQVPPSTLDTSVGSNSSVAAADLTMIEVTSENSPPKLANKSDTLPMKSYKMPNRNVVSRIKAMIESGSKDETEKDGRRPQRSPRKGGRWDAVMSQIEASKNKQRSRSTRKEVKSKVLQSLSTPPSTAPRRSSGETNKSKSRRTRGRPEASSPPTQETVHSSVHSSMSDLCSSPRSTKKRLGSPGGSDGPAHSTPRISSPRQQQPPSTLAVNNNNVVPTGATNNNNHNNVAGNNHSQSRATPHSQRSPTVANPQRRLVNGRTNQQPRINNSEAKKNSSEVSRVNLEKSPSAARKPAVPRRSSSYVTPKQQNAQPTKDRGAKESSPVTRGLPETREQADQTDPTYEAFQLKHAEASVQALSVIVQYLAHQLDGFSAPKLKKDCERMKTKWMEARLEADELRAGHRRIEEQLNDQQDEHQKALDQMRNYLEVRHAERVAELETALQDERQRFEGRLEEFTKEHQAVIARLQAKHEADLIRKEAETDRRSLVHDQGASLRAEVESLKTVLELKTQESAVFRSENEILRRDVKAKEAIEQKYEALEARCEDLKAQLQRKESLERQLVQENKVLLESIHHESKQKKRLSQHNEELQWRLRQNNEVVTVLANQLASPPQRLSRSLGPEHMDHTQSPPASPMVKSMVEKSDSVSWTLEIEETPEAMASRLLRLSGSTRGISPSDSRPKRPRQPSTSPGASTVSRQSSLRTTPQRAVVLRARSKSVSVADSVPKEAWAPNFSSTPSVVRRRPRSDPAASPVVAVEANPGPRPQEAGGEAMISEETSASSSEDESSASSDNPRSAMEVSWSESEG